MSLLQSISSFFGGSANSRSSRRDQTMLSTRDAFSLPGSQQQDFGGSNDLGESSSRSFTYPPPPLGGTYDTVPQSSYDLRQGNLSPTSSSGFFGGRRAQQPILPTAHHRPDAPGAYPNLTRTWQRIRKWLHKQYPELDDTLNYGIDPQALLDIETHMGFQLPASVRDSYLVVDGQEAESAAGCSEGLFFGLNFLPLDDVLEEWRFWREVDDDPATGANPRLRDLMESIPPNWIRKEYSQRGWIPLITDKAGNYMGVDLSPGESGVAGQIIIFGRDFDTKVVIFRGEGAEGWGHWLGSFADELELGEGFELGASGDASDGSEDGVGYEGYYGGGTSHKGDGGGDSGITGLRLTGEYRGWSVLEAWADRSVRRWKETGVLVDEEPEQVEEPQSSADGLGIGIQGPSPQLIPTVSVEPAPDPSPETAAAGPSTLSSRRMQRPMSLSKMPAPAPVLLPTADDILPSPTDSANGSPRNFRRPMDEEAHINMPNTLHQRQDLPMIAEAATEVTLMAPASEPRPEPTSLLTDLNEHESASLGEPQGATTPTAATPTTSVHNGAAAAPGATVEKSGPVDDLLDRAVSAPEPAVAHTRKDSRL
ncbi:hypothetical protein BKA62DRAFT_683779 [Auriculariales sp. MPI-PUGE-AT-0066]|nr:hypothetical protein BKA62DRAFT_683779 [Auriculariales sp. MPI-PUGE-AT-0066]